MKTIHAVLLFFAIMILSSIVIAHVIVSAKAQTKKENLTQLCDFLTEDMNNKLEENSSCASYYCYYTPYAPPEGFEKTSTLCACDCKLQNGTIVTVQVLTPTS